MRAASALLLVVAACGSSGTRPTSPPDNRPDEPVAEAPIDAAVDAATPCVARCVESRQMQAISLDVITRRCEEECRAAR